MRGGRGGRERGEGRERGVGKGEREEVGEVKAGGAFWWLVC